MDWEKVDQYTEDMMSGDKFPPPQLVYDEDGKTQQEGLHRIYAAERVGIESIPVVVSSDTRNQDIYPYNQLSENIVSQDELLGGNSSNGGDDGSSGALATSSMGEDNSARIQELEQKLLDAKKRVLEAEFYVEYEADSYDEVQAGQAKVDDAKAKYSSIEVELDALKKSSGIETESEKKANGLGKG